MAASEDNEAIEIYSHARWPQRSSLAGTLQLFGWIFFHPSAWRHLTGRIGLASDFPLTALTASLWRDRTLRTVLFRGHVLGPLGVTLLLLAECALLGAPPRETAMLAGACFLSGIVGGIVSGAGTMAAVGMAVGVVGGLCGCAALLVVRLATGQIAFTSPSDTATVMGDFARHGAVGTAAMIVAFGVASGIVFVSVGGVAVQSSRGLPSLRHILGGLVLGALVGSVCLGVALLTAFALPFPLAIGATGFLFGAAAGVVVSGRHSLGVAYGLGCGLANYATVIWIIPLTGDVLVTGIAIGALLSAWFSLPFLWASRLGGLVAGVVAGGLGLWGGAAVIMSSAFPRAWLLFANMGSSLLWIFAAMFLAWTQEFWRPLLTYPLEEAFGLVLHRLEQAAPATGSSWLRFHPGFWDETQRWPFRGLEDHLLLVLERNPAEGRAALAFLATSPQRWAAQAAQIELIAREMERCLDLDAVARIATLLGSNELEGPVSGLLRRFGQISLDVGVALGQTSTHNQRIAVGKLIEQLAGLVGELDRSSDRLAVRFRPVAHRWQLMLERRVGGITEELAKSNEIDNPYVIGVPLTLQQEIFVGRTDISARIEQLLLDRRRPPLMLFGQRRMGKTSLLNNLGHLLPTHIVPLFVDLQGPASTATDHAGFLYNLARGMASSAQKQRQLALPPLGREQLTADPFTAFDEWLERVEGALGDRTALLALDEFEVLDRALRDGRLSETSVLGMLRHLVQHRLRWKVLIATSYSQDDLSRWSSYLINVQQVKVGYLRDDEAEQLIERPVPHPVLRYRPEASARVRAITRGHPFLVQLLCSEIVTLKNEQAPAERRLATEADVAAAVPSALAHGSLFFADIERNQVDEAGALLLRHLAASGPTATLSPEAAARLVPGREEAVLRRLCDTDLVERTEQGYRFQVELIRCWFAASSSGAPARPGPAVEA